MTPGARVRALIEELGLDQIRFAEKLEVSRQTISNIVNDHQPISREMAGRLALLSGRPTVYWLQDEFPNNETGGGARGHFAPGVLVDHQILKAMELGLIEVDPFDPQLLQNTSLDLRLSAFVISLEGHPEHIVGEQGYLLKAGRAANVQARETVRVAKSIVARVGAMTSVSRFGIMMAHGFQIDPGFEGHLEFCLFNASNKDFRLVGGMPIVSIEFTALSEEPSGQAEARNRDRSEVIEHLGGTIPPVECDALIREALKPLVKTLVRKDGVFAEVPELDIRQRNRTAKAATDDAIHEILTTLRASLTNPRYRELRAKYEKFFESFSEDFFLSANSVRVVLRGLKYPIDDNIADLGNGKYLPLPQGSAELPLDWVATKIGVGAGDLVVRLTRPTKPPLVASEAAGTRA